MATKGTAKALTDAGLSVQPVNKVAEGRPHIVDMIKNNEISFIVNVTENKRAISDSYEIRKCALQNKVTYYTTIASAKAACIGMNVREEITVNSLKSWQ